MIVLAALLAPGLGEVRDRLRDAAGGRLVAAVLLEALSCGSYVLMFRGIFLFAEVVADERPDRLG